VRTPTFEPKNRTDLFNELAARAQAWLVDWHPRDDGDFATALFRIVARLESEVTERLNRAPERTFRSFLDWLGVRGKAGTAAELPVVFTMTPGSDPVDAPARVQLQVNAGDTPVKFETESALRILPGTLATIVAVDPSGDHFYTPVPDIFRAAAPPLVPNSWQLKTDAAAGAATLQLDPPLGLDVGITLVDPSGLQYAVTAVQGAMVTIAPPLGAALGAATAVMTRLDSFMPFGPNERDRQEHALYIGSPTSLNVDSEAWIAIEGGATIPADAAWSYSGKPTPDGQIGWIPFNSADVRIVPPDILLRKPQGSIEAAKVGDSQSRWLKAAHPAGKISQPSIASGLRLSVNCKLPPGTSDQPAVIGLEGIANTTPLVLESGFYPFGREPRQFDAFYLGSKEAFSKPSGFVTAHFTLGDAMSAPRAAIGFSDALYLSVGVGHDGRLQRLVSVVTTPSGGSPTPTISFLSPTQPVGADGRAIGLEPNYRPGAVLVSGIPYVSAAAGTEVWLWTTGSTGDDWQSLGKPLATAQAVTHTLLTRTAGGFAAYAIADGKLQRIAVGIGGWQDDGLLTPDPIAIIAPIVPLSGRAGSQSEDDGIFAVTTTGDMYVRTAGNWARVVGGPAAVDTTFYPLVVNRAAGLQGFTRDGDSNAIAFNIAGGPGFAANNVTLQGHAADFIARGDEIIVVMLAQKGNDPAAVAVWADAMDDQQPVFEPSAGQRDLVEGPLLVGAAGTTRFFLVAGGNGEAFILPVGQIQFVSGASVGEAAVFTDAAHNWSSAIAPLIDLTPALAASADRDIATVTKVLGDQTHGWAMPLDAHAHVPDNTSAHVHGALYSSAAAGLRNGTVKAVVSPPDPAGAIRLRLDPADTETQNLDHLYVTGPGGNQRIVAISAMNAGAGGNDATISDGLAWAAGTAVQYEPIDAGANETVSGRPVIDVSALDPSIIGTLSSGTLEFIAPIAPASQTPLIVSAADKLVVLSAAWTTAPAGSHVDFSVKVDLFGTWTVFAPATPRNPTLSWEYYDGTSWRPIPGLKDKTQALAKEGDVTFCVPADIQPTDVVGHASSWIRARLVGGDYGQETVTVTSTTSGSTTTQTVHRNTDSIRAPYVASLRVTYELCCAAAPDFVLTLDNGSLKNQTDVNRNPGALVEYFMPLSVALARAAGNDASANAGDRALFLGFDTPLTGGPIQILFLVNDGTFDDAYPLRVDALVGNQFKPIVIEDDTRGLNESGVLTMTLAESPRETELFGATAYWLRVRPGTRLAKATEWQPSIRAAYLNATWASAAETQAFEMLGSSIGSPEQKFALARPPVIEGSLKLRVLEPLGDDDLNALRASGVDVQPSFESNSIPVRTGYYWVLWTEVVDPADSAATDRVYALNDADGTITFGNGRHGKIPPIVSNGILAEQYQRSGGAAANSVTAWSTISLVTALSGVNAVFAPDGAAGGADPQNADETLRFAPANLRVRERAVTLPDLEILAIQSSRDIGHVRAIGTPGGVKLVLAMRGADATPGAKDIRELRRYLVSVTTPMLAVESALDIVAPRIVRVHIDLTLAITSIESSGSVAKSATDCLVKFFDAGAGGLDKTGWRLGDVPSDTDIAAVLTGIKGVDAIDAIAITRIDGKPLTTLAPDQLVQLAPNGIVVNVVLAETEMAG